MLVKLNFSQANPVSLIKMKQDRKKSSESEAQKKTR